MTFDRNEFWRDRRVFVTGASGLVGGWVVKRLLKLEADVVCLIRDWVPDSQLIHEKDITRINVARGDLQDRDLLERVLGEYEVESVIHLAAQTIVSIANRNPVSTFESNIRGTWNLLEACRRCPTVKQIVVASSDKAYGDHDDLPYTEEDALHARHPYDVSKSCADMISQSYAETFDLPVVVTRCGNFYGGGDLNWNRIIPGTIRSVIRGERPVIRSDGKFIRDYFYIEDGASAYVILVEELARNPELSGEVFNFSNENQTTVLEIVNLILKLMDSDLEPEIQDNVSNEIKHQYLSAEKARETLAWSPQYSLEEGLKKTINWYRGFFNKNHD